MGLPAKRILEITLFSHEMVYQIMKNHFELFMDQWKNVMDEDSKAEYLASRPIVTREVDVLESFRYIRELKAPPRLQDTLEFARMIQSGILAYAYADNDLNEGFTMGLYADFVVEKFLDDNP